ncbi:MAG: hypothetical protein QOG02_2219, partial [Gaiellales bacterium]|nr:hypothetical protein [Gaiellales bacterium]
SDPLTRASNGVGRGHPARDAAVPDPCQSRIAGREGSDPSRGFATNRSRGGYEVVAVGGSDGAEL